MSIYLVGTEEQMQRFLTPLAGAFLAHDKGKVRRWTLDESALPSQAAQQQAAVEMRETAAEIQEPIRLEGEAEEVARSPSSVLRTRRLVPDR